MVTLSMFRNVTQVHKGRQIRKVNPGVTLLFSSRGKPVVLMDRNQSAAKTVLKVWQTPAQSSNRDRRT